jgi:hypothetical protein
MVAKIDMKKTGGRVKGAGDVPAKAKGAGPTQPNRTQSPDVISAPRAAHSSYGMGQYAGPSSLTPLDDANKGRSQLGINMSQTSEGESDPILNEIIKRGTAAAGISGRLSGEPGGVYEGVGESQLRPVSTKQAVPTHPAMVGSNAQRQPTKR